jgi:ribose 5-phosphate isomerase A
MTGLDPAAAAKRAAAEAAVAEIEADMIVGLGTGSTAAFAIEALGRRVAQGLRVTAAATSLATERAARAAGIPLRDFADLSALDLAIDGADEIDPQFRAIKGAGGALLREKIVATAARRMICVVDEAKPVERLGTRPLPVEALPFARNFVMRSVESLGAQAVLRRNEAGAPVPSDQGNLLIDCHFAHLPDPAALAAQLEVIPGILGHGLFLSEIDALFVGTSGGVVRREREKARG